MRALDEMFSGTNDQSGTVHVTLRNDFQAIAKFLLGPQGSIVLMEPKTGAIRAMWSYPSYDPNLVADIDYDAAYAYLTALQNDPRDPLLANAYQQRYMPGSTFKVLTTGIALDDGVVGLDSVFPEEREFLPPQTNDPIQNYGDTTCGGDLATVFARSCNTAFAGWASRSDPTASRRAWDDGVSARTSRSTCPARRRARSATVRP